MEGRISNIVMRFINRAGQNKPYRVKKEKLIRSIIHALTRYWRLNLTRLEQKGTRLLITCIDSPAAIGICP